MAINTQKFLPSSKGGALTKVAKISKGSVAVISEKSQKNISIIRVKVIEIDKLLKGTITSQKKELDIKRKEGEKKRFSELESKLETKPKAEKGKIEMPKVPRMGFLDWIKNFIGNIILGYFAVRLIDQLPKLKGVISFIGKASDFVLDIGGKLLDGLATFIDWGYKAVDFSRGLIGKTFGDDALKNFDKLTGDFEKFMNLAIIVGMAGADFGMDRLGRKLTGKGAERAAEKGAGTLARRGAGRIATRVGARVAGKSGARLAGKIGSKALKAIPLLGAGVAIIEGIMRIKDGDYVGGLLSFGTAIPVAGWAFLALDIAREFMGGPEFDKSVGRGFGGKPGLTDKQVQKRTPHMSGPSFMGVASGGIAKGKKRRTLNTKKSKYKRKLTPRKPGQIQMQPGADVGGEDKIFGLFRNPLKMAQNAIDMMNPFKVIENTGKQLGKSDYFGPILAITSKILLGQKPSQKDYENVGLGINLLVSKGLNEGQLKGGLAAAFAEGGLVDPKALDAISQGGDITNWVAKAFKESTENNTKETLRDIQDNLALKSSETQRKDDRIDPDQPIDTQDGEGGFSTNSGDYKELLDLISSKESAGAGYNAYNEGGTGGGYHVVGYGGDSREGPLRRALTDMTIKEIMAHQKNVNPPIHAAGRYQIIGDTLAALIRGNYGPTGVNINDKFTPDVQDKLGIALIKYRLKTGATPENFINEWRGLKFVNRTKLQSAISKAQRGKTYRIDTQKNIAGMDTRLTGGAGLKQYITGDHTDRKHYAADHDSIAGKIDNYHDHLAFADRKTAQSAFNFFSKKFKVTDFLGYDYSASELARRHGGPDHPAGLAFDIPGSQWGGTPGTSSGSKEWAGSAKVRSALNQFLAGSSNSNSTIAKAYEKGGETLGGPHLAMLGEKGREIVVDADSSGPARDMLLAINQAKDHKGVMKAIQQYAPYDAMSPQTIVMPSSGGESDYDSEMSGGGVMMMDGGGGDSYDPFDALEMGG